MPKRPRTPKLTPKQILFCKEYLVDLNGTQAAIRSGYSKNCASEIASENLTKPLIKQQIDKEFQKRSDACDVSKGMVFKRFWEMANTNVSEIVEYKVECCRNCHGISFKFQWYDEDEFNEEILKCKIANAGKSLAEQTPLPTNEGGYGFTPKLAPNPDCRKCCGMGYSRQVITPTKQLKGGAALLYDGVKITKDGIQVLLQDRSKALDSVARHLGMFPTKLEHSGPGGAPIEYEKIIDPIKQMQALQQLLKE